MRPALVVLSLRLALVEQVRPEDVRAVAHTWSHATPTIVAVGPDETPIWD